MVESRVMLVVGRTMIIVVFMSEQARYSNQHQEIKLYELDT